MSIPKPFTAQSVFKTVADADLLTPPFDNCLKVQLPKPALNLKNIYKKMSHREESNPQHSHYRSDALPSCATVAFDMLQTLDIGILYHHSVSLNFCIIIQHIKQLLSFS